MGTTKQDRRSRRTRQLLGNALIELMFEKRFEDITVQDILDRADIGRSTFYAHYTDKENLLMSEIGRVIRQLDEYTTEGDGVRPGLLPSIGFFRHVQQHRRLMQAFMWGQGAELLTQELLGQFSTIVEHNLRAMTRAETASSVPLPVLSRFVANTFLLLLRWWFDDDMRHSPEQMDDMFQKLVMPAIHQSTAQA